MRRYPWGQSSLVRFIDVTSNHAAPSASAHWCNGAAGPLTWARA